MRRIIIGLLLVAVSFSASAIRIKLATVSPEGSKWMLDIEAAAEKIKKETNNRVQFKFYAGGVMGSDTTVLRKIRSGQLHGAALASGSLSGVYPTSIIYGLPSLYKTVDEVNYIRTGLDDDYISGFKDVGYEVLGIAGAGFAYVMSKEPIRNVKDLGNSKVWVPSSDKSAEDMVKAFEVNPVTLSIGDVYTGLQTGIVDTVTVSPIAAIALQWHTQIKYMLDIPLFYLYGLLIVDNKVMDKLSREDQATVRRHMNEAMGKIDRYSIEDNRNAYEALKKQGIRVIKPKNGDVEGWESKSAKYNLGLVTNKVISPNIWEKLQSLRSEYATLQKAP